MKLKFMTNYIQKTKRVPKWCRYRHNFSGAQLSPLVIIIIIIIIIMRNFLKWPK